jgi:hypothetical protein
MTDLFENTILCGKCNVKMEKAQISRNGFLLRAVLCRKCGEKSIHPQDLEEYERYHQLRNKVYKVKLRTVGNSYAVSIPKEIVGMMRAQERMMNEMVQLCLERFGKLSLEFGGGKGNDD